MPHPLNRRTVVWLAAVVVVSLAFVLLAATAGSADARTEHRSTDACDYAREWRDVPCTEVNRAITEAAREFHIDEARFRRMIRCESRFHPFVGARYRGLTQQGPGFVAAVYPRFNAAVEPDVLGNPLAPFDNARTAAWVISREGYSQWECKG